MVHYDRSRMTFGSFLADPDTTMGDGLNPALNLSNGVLGALVDFLVLSGFFDPGDQVTLAGLQGAGFQLGRLCIERVRRRHYDSKRHGNGRTVVRECQWGSADHRSAGVVPNPNETPGNRRSATSLQGKIRNLNRQNGRLMYRFAERPPLAVFVMPPSAYAGGLPTKLNGLGHSARIEQGADPAVFAE